MERAQGEPSESLRDEQVAATRRAIVASARRLFGNHGYTSTSVDDVARAARVTKGAVYHHFQNKEDVFRTVYDEVEGEAQRRTGEAFMVEGTVVDQLVSGVQGYLDATLDPEVQRITLIDGPAVFGPTPEGAPADAPGHATMREFLAAAVSDGHLVEVDPEGLAFVIGGSCLQGGIVIARAEDPVATREQIGSALEAMIRGLDATVAVRRRPARRRTG